LVTNIVLSTLFSNTLSQCSPLSMRERVSHPHKTTGKINGTKDRVMRTEAAQRKACTYGLVSLALILGRGFESHSSHGCRSAFLYVVLSYDGSIPRSTLKGFIISDKLQN
jgi:hypothetical protein